MRSGKWAGERGRYDSRVLEVDAQREEAGRHGAHDLHGRPDVQHDERRIEHGGEHDAARVLEERLLHEVTEGVVVGIVGVAQEPEQLAPQHLPSAQNNAARWLTRPVVLPPCL